MIHSLIQTFVDLMPGSKKFWKMALFPIGIAFIILLLTSFKANAQSDYYGGSGNYSESQAVSGDTSIWTDMSIYGFPINQTWQLDILGVTGAGANDSIYIRLETSNLESISSRSASNWVLANFMPNRNFFEPDTNASGVVGDYGFVPAHVGSTYFVTVPHAGFMHFDGIAGTDSSYWKIKPVYPAGRYVRWKIYRTTNSKVWNIRVSWKAN